MSWITLSQLLAPSQLVSENHCLQIGTQNALT